MSRKVKVDSESKIWYKRSCLPQTSVLYCRMLCGLLHMPFKALNKLKKSFWSLLIHLLVKVDTHKIFLTTTIVTHRTPGPCIPSPIKGQTRTDYGMNWEGEKGVWQINDRKMCSFWWNQWQYGIWVGYFRRPLVCHCICYFYVLHKSPFCRSTFFTFLIGKTGVWTGESHGTVKLDFSNDSNTGVMPSMASFFNGYCLKHGLYQGSATPSL